MNYELAKLFQANPTDLRRWNDLLLNMKEHNYLICSLLQQTLYLK